MVRRSVGHSVDLSDDTDGSGIDGSLQRRETEVELSRKGPMPQRSSPSPVRFAVVVLLTLLVVLVLFFSAYRFQQLQTGEDALPVSVVVELVDGTPERALSHADVPRSRPSVALASPQMGLVGPCFGSPNATLALVTIAENIPSRWVVRMRRNRYRYAERHGYVHCEFPSLDPTRKPSWSKVMAVRSLLGSFDRVVWVDQDVVFLNISLSIPELIAPVVPAIAYRNVDLIAQQDIGGRLMNSGFMIMQNTEWMRRLLEQAYRVVEEPAHSTHKWVGLTDQYGLSHILQMRSSARQQLIPAWRDRNVHKNFFLWPFEELNFLYHGPHDSANHTPRLVHFAGEPAKRMRLLLRAEAKVVYDPPLEVADEACAQPRAPSVAETLRHSDSESRVRPKSQCAINPLAASFFSFPSVRARIGPCTGWPDSSTALLWIHSDGQPGQPRPETPAPLLEYAAAHRYAVCELERMDQMRDWSVNVLESLVGLLDAFERVLWLADPSLVLGVSHRSVEQLAHDAVQRSLDFASARSARPLVCAVRSAEESDVIGDLLVSAASGSSGLSSASFALVQRARPDLQESKTVLRQVLRAHGNLTQYERVYHSDKRSVEAKAPAGLQLPPPRVRACQTVHFLPPAVSGTKQPSER
mmetsp:Transcript_14808/g.37644  ORF Transcript_14808/g.37644 Transcript_14808/m.37644 type:complete len:639 (-) Transcript_14808:66-1982(-)